jgi:hypothetical protein
MEPTRRLKRKKAPDVGFEPVWSFDDRLCEKAIG